MTTTGGISNAGPVSTPLTKTTGKRASEATTGDVSIHEPTSLPAGEIVGDRVDLSAVAQRLHSESSFDQEKVDAIRLALAKGAYPLDTRKMAESFLALEKMIGHSPEVN